MKLKEVKTIKEKSSPPVWEDKVTLSIDSKQFPAMKGMGAAKNIKMVIEGEITRFSRDNDNDKEDYTIHIKKAGIFKKDSSQQIKENISEGD